MPRQQLKEALDALHRELESGDEIPEDDRRALLQAAQEIQEALAEERTQQDDQPLGERIASSVRDFETSHPRLTEILEKVSEALANMGI